MDNSALIDSFSEFKDFKKIDRLTLTAILEEVFRTALKKKFGTDDNFNIVVTPTRGTFRYGATVSWLPTDRSKTRWLKCRFRKPARYRTTLKWVRKYPRK